MNTESSAAGAADHVVGGDLSPLRLPGKARHIASGPRVSALRKPVSWVPPWPRRHGVAIGAHEPDPRRLGPGMPPIRRGLAPSPLVNSGLARERGRRDGGALAEAGREEVGRGRPGNAGCRSSGVAPSSRAGSATFPADLDAAEQIGLLSRHAVERRGPKRHAGAEDLGIGWKVIVVPRRFLTRPAFLSLVQGRLPRSNSSAPRACRSRATSTSSRSESALTTEMPTPCKPPEVM